MLMGLLVSAALAQDGGGGFGAGVVLGEPTGVTLGFGMGKAANLQAHLAWSLGRDWLRGSVDYLYFPTSKAVPDGGFTLAPYVGLGAVVAVDDDGPRADVGLGARIPLGVRLLPNGAPVDVFAEVAPGLWVLPYTDLLVEGGIGVRYWF